jgi:hypothetical protein
MLSASSSMEHDVCSNSFQNTVISFDFSNGTFTIE